MTATPRGKNAARQRVPNRPGGAGEGPLPVQDTGHTELRREMEEALAGVERQQVADESATLDRRSSIIDAAGTWAGHSKKEGSAMPSQATQNVPDLTRAEAAKFLGVGVRTLDRWTARGYVTHYRLGDLHVMYAKNDLLAYVAAARIEAKTP